MSIRFIDRNVVQTAGGYSFEYGGKIHERSTREEVHRFFLKKCRLDELDTVKLRFPREKYYLHFTLDAPEKFSSKRELRSMLAKESGGAWIEKKNGTKRYFVEEGWLFSNIKEVSKEEFTAHQPSSLMQKVAKLVLGVLPLASLAINATRAASVHSHHGPGAGILGFSLLQASPVFAQMPALAEFTNKTDTTNFVLPTTFTRFYENLYPKRTRLVGGGYVDVWHVYDQKAAGFRVYIQIRDASELPVGSNFRYYTNKTNDQAYPTVVGLMDGGFVVACQGLHDGNTDIYGQIFDATGTPKGSEFRMNTNTTDFQWYPALAALMEGGFATAWQGLQTGNWDIYGQIFDDTGAPVGPEFRMNTETTNAQSDPALEGLVGGGFVSGWQGNQAGDDDVYGQSYSARGVPKGSEFRFNTQTTSKQWSLTLKGRPKGGFSAFWMSDHTGNFNLYGRRYDASGAPEGAESPVNFNVSV